jgi:hypothetical protein
MEALGSATLAAMLAHRLFFTFTEREFMEVVDQTVSDFDAGCSLGFITINAAKKFRSIFGISADGRVELRVFRAQALWGERGRGYGVSTCTNHIEGLHGRLNAVTRGMASPAKRLGRIVQIITASAGDWSERVAKGRHKALLRQAERAARESASDDQCHRPECDGGLIFAKRYDMEQFPCPHIQVEVPKLEDLRPEQFELNDSGAPVIVAQTHNPEGPAWTLPIRRYHAPNGKIGLADPATGACGEHERFVVRLRAELQYLNHSKEFPYSVGEMLFRLGQIHGPEMRTPGERKEANTAVLMECVEIVQKTREW